MTTPFAKGDQLTPDWEVSECVNSERLTRVTCHDGEGRTVYFRLTPRSDSSRAGPFDLEDLAIAYEPGETPFADLQPVGLALRDRVRPHLVGSADSLLAKWRGGDVRQTIADDVWRFSALGDPADIVADLDPAIVRHVRLEPSDPDTTLAWVQALNDRGIHRVDLQDPEDGARARREPSSTHQLAADDWRDRLRQRLVGRSDLSMLLGELLPVDALPPWPCHLPWTRLEVSEDGVVGPCCVSYQRPRFEAGGLRPSELWNGEAMQAFRRAMADPAPSTCRSSCPVLVGRTEPPASFRIRGGPPAVVEDQISLVESLLAGAVEVPVAPPTVCLATTSYCNYDCLMCACGAEGTLDDQLATEFYADLNSMPGDVLVLELNGGEPLASPTCRAFLESLDTSSAPHLRVNLITNGSFLTREQLERLTGVRWGNLTVSLNAATPEIYRLVNRGLPYERIRRNLDALLELRRSRPFDMTYSMVLLRQNVDQIEDFAELALRDAVAVRYMLPFRNRNATSIMKQRDDMGRALRGLQTVAGRLLNAGRRREADGALASARILMERLNRNVLLPL